MMPTADEEGVVHHHSLEDLLKYVEINDREQIARGIRQIEKNAFWRGVLTVQNEMKKLLGVRT